MKTYKNTIDFTEAFSLSLKKEQNRGWKKMKWSKQICSKNFLCRTNFATLQKEKPHPKQLLQSL